MIPLIHRTVQVFNHVQPIPVLSAGDDELSKLVGKQNEEKQEDRPKTRLCLLPKDRPFLSEASFLSDRSFYFKVVKHRQVWFCAIPLYIVGTFLGGTVKGVQPVPNFEDLIVIPSKL